jgi:uncharacterized pyridoxamine 5'-phosphate oxidase family protein/NAD-dependent dihydropyrimidine dehydrogenase PreA subunit
MRVNEDVMDETTRKAMKLLLDLKSLAFATVAGKEPDVRIINAMLVEEDGVYFTTARGKPFYEQLRQLPEIAICGVTDDSVSVRLLGHVKQCSGRKMMEKILEHNPGLVQLYPGEKSDILEAFHLYRAKGEIFDLSGERPIRDRFAFGGDTVNPPGYRITSKCTACGACSGCCPVEVIQEGEPYRIDGRSCLECGRCVEICPEDAIEPGPGL